MLPDDNEVAASVTSILQELAADLPLIRPFQRYKIPYGATLQRIGIFSDSSIDLVSFAVYLDVQNSDLSTFCNFLFANSYTRRASVPSLEMLAFVIGLTELHALVLKHFDNLLPSSTMRVR